MWITGQVVDGYGRALPGVSIEAASTSTAGRRTVISNTRGDYILQDLRAGVYTITFSHAGFGTLERTTCALTSYVATVNARLHRDAES